MKGLVVALNITSCIFVVVVEERKKRLVSE